MALADSPVPSGLRATYVAMILRGLSPATALFYIRIRPAISGDPVDLEDGRQIVCDDNGYLTLAQMAALNRMTPTAASEHARRLVKFKALIRIHYRAWSSTDKWLSEEGQRRTLAECAARRVAEI